jgi:hypothetical protein
VEPPGRAHAGVRRGRPGDLALLARGHYASTPAYLPVLRLHGWNDLQGEAHRLSKAGQWAAMGELITDEILHAFAVVGEPRSIAGEIERRFGGIVTDIGLYTPYEVLNRTSHAGSSQT